MSFRRVKKSAWDRLLGYLSRRDHTETELIKKLLQYHEVEEIQAAILRAREHEMIPKPEVMAERTVAQLIRKGKGSMYISAYLKKKGLPPAPASEDLQIEEALKTVQKRLRMEGPPSFEQKRKIQRFLMNRGFRGSVVSSVLSELSKKSTKAD